MNMFRFLRKSWEILVNHDDILFLHTSSVLPQPLSQGKPLANSPIDVPEVPQDTSPPRTHTTARSGSSSSHSNHPRPSTIAELAAQAREILWDPSKDLRHWLHTAESSRCTAEARIRSKDYEGAFVEFAKAAMLVLEKIPTHKEYWTRLNTEQRHNLSMNGQDILDWLSLLRPVIAKQYEDWQARQRGNPGSSPTWFVEPNLSYEEQRSGDAPRTAYREEAQFFSCGICLESHRNDFLAYAMPCGHLYCRNCLRGYAVSKIEEHRYPIPCPGCSADKDQSDPGELDELAIQHLGLNQKQYEIFNEMQMAPFSTIIHCRKCLNTIFVDKEEYQEAQQVIVCPLPGCNHVWCKSCSQTVATLKGPKHSCDGSSELNHLMRQQGWKHCPGCQTPAEKVDGCNHMTCVSPGCSAHFCYLCGELITQSVLRREIRNAVSRHYGARCMLF